MSRPSKSSLARLYYEDGMQKDHISDRWARELFNRDLHCSAGHHKSLNHSLKRLKWHNGARLTPRMEQKLIARLGDWEE